jgi:hypothetical protein
LEGQIACIGAKGNAFNILVKKIIIKYIVTKEDGKVWSGFV